MGHAGELLQGAVHRNGRAEPFLITLPAPCLCSEATVEPAPEWSVSPVWRRKALRAVQMAAARWAWPHAVALTVRSKIPVAHGFGSSTADCVAAVRAMAELTGRTCSDAEIAKIVQYAEGASDSTMFGVAPVVFLPERGECLTRIPHRWPHMHVTAFDLGGPPVNTVGHVRPHYTVEEIDVFVELLVRVERAFALADAAALGECATRSATIQQRHRPHARWAELMQLAASTSAFGVAISHSGTVAALLAPGPLAVAGSFSYSLAEAEEGSFDVDLVDRGR